MLTKQSHPIAAAMRITTMPCPGSWGNAPKSSGLKWKSQRFYSLKFSVFWRMLVILALPGGIAPLAAQSSGQGSGSVQGAVMNGATRAYLEGATVQIAALSKQVLTDESGRFLLDNIPAGPQTLRVSYMGLEDESREITVNASASTTANFELQSDVYVLEKFVVSGEREGNAAAIVAQKNAPNVVNIIAMDAFGNVADGNIGNFLQRLPGIASGKSNGDVQSVSVRGMPSSMSTVSMDGSTMATANTDDSSGKGFSIDIIPAELISKLKLTKSPTPDMPADSLGGNIDLVTKSAWELANRLISYRAGYNWNSYRSDTEWTPSAALTFMDTFGKNRNLGLTLTASYSETTNTRDRLQNNLNYAASQPQTIVHVRLRLMDDYFSRIRTGYGFKLDWRASPLLTTYLSANYTHFKYDMDRNDHRFSGNNREADYSQVSREAIEQGATPRASNGSTAASLAPGFTGDYQEILNASVQTLTAIEPRKRDLYKFGTGAKLTLPNGWLKFDASYGYSTDEKNYSDFLTTASNIGVGVILDTRWDKKRPALGQSYGDKVIFAGANPEMYATAVLSRRPSKVIDETFNARIDWRHVFPRINFPLAVQAGAALHVRDYSTLINTENYDYNGTADGMNFTQFSREDSDYGLFRDYYPRMGRWDSGKVAALFESHPQYFSRRGTDVVNPESTIREITSAAYILADTHIWGSLYFLTGARFEQTRQDMEGGFQRRSDLPLIKVDQKSTYEDIYPSAHLRFNFTPDLQARASWSTSNSRPGYNQLLPRIRHDTALDYVYVNNPDLIPCKSNNFDISLEYYSRNVGAYTLGVFRREMKNFIITVPMGIVGPDTFGGLYEGFQYFSYDNAEKATVQGVEFNFTQNLTFLPGIWKRCSLMGNLTWLESKGQFGDDAKGSQVPGFKPWTANVGITIPYKKLLVRIFYNYNSGYLGTYSENELNRIYFFEDKALDLNIQYRFRRWLTFYCDVNNVFNYAPGTYVINSNHVLTHERNGTRFSMGISGRF